MKRIKVVTPFFILAVFVLWFGCGSDVEMKDSIDKIPVKTARVIQKEIAIPIHASGILSAARESRLSFKIGGIVEAIYFDEGQLVKEGQVLAKLNLREIQAQVDQARSAFEKAKRDHQRAKNLYADSVVTLEQLQNAETGLEVARSNLEIAEFNLRHSKIIAPSDGEILKRFAEENEMVGPGTPVFYFGATGEAWRAEVGITEKDIVHVHLGDSASVSFDAYPKKNFPGKVTEIAEIADPMSGTYETEIQLDPQDMKLVSGFVAKADLFPSNRQKFYWIPVEALVEADGETAFVFTHVDGKSKRIQIKIGSIYNQNVAVLKGLEGVKTVVTDGVSYLIDGSEIQIVNQ